MAGRQPSVRVLGEDPRLMRRLTLTLCAVVALAATGCSGDDGSSDSSPTSSTTSSPTALPTVEDEPGPKNSLCYNLDYDAALAYTSEAKPTNCKMKHTAVTYAIGTLDTTIDGHLLAVDSKRAKEQVATTCPEKLTDFVGGSLDERRLSMLRPVWFTPTLEQAETGAAWFRCDLVALGGEETLAPLEGEVKGVLATPEGRDKFAMCATAPPGSEDFERVLCSEPHSWRAIQVVGFDTDKYPGDQAAEARGQGPCEDAGESYADDPLNFKWAYERPTAQQWEGGQTFGRCWAPEN